MASSDLGVKNIASHAHEYLKEFFLIHRTPYHPAYYDEVDDIHAYTHRGCLVLYYQ